ncbi:MAG: type II toxin-antitoxin system RelE/ParE family toxin [Micropruina sp.]
MAARVVRGRLRPDRRRTGSTARRGTDVGAAVGRHHQGLASQEHEGAAARVRGRSEIRVLFAFDPKRRAILLVTGDKSRDWNRWYKRHIPIADQRFDDHLTTLRRRA